MKFKFDEEPEKSCESCDNAPFSSFKCKTLGCSGRSGLNYDNWKPKQKESTMKVTAEAYKLLGECRDYWMQKDGYLLHCFGETVETPQHGSLSCDLCEKYLGLKKPCAGCPISQKTGSAHCEKTPYGAWNGLTTANNVPAHEIKVTGEHLDKHLAETDFLSALFDECVVEEERTYSIGDAFEHEGKFYMLVVNGNGSIVQLNCISEGCHRWNPGTSVREYGKITERELKIISGNARFRPVTLKISEVENK